MVSPLVGPHVTGMGVYKQLRTKDYLIAPPTADPRSRNRDQNQRGLFFSTSKCKFFLMIVFFMQNSNTIGKDNAFVLSEK